LPPHWRQTVTSTAKTRARSFAQPSRRGRGEASVGERVSFAAAVRSSASWSAGIAAARRHYRPVYQGPVVATTIYYLGFALFMPVQATLDPALRFDLVTVLFLSFAAVLYLVRERHVFSAAEAALARLDALELALSGPTPAAASEAEEAPLTSFERIELRGAAFSYVDDGRTTFTVGPVDLSVGRGEVVFITGSNGSGKTTLMKLLTGLYPPDRGEIWLDGEPISPRLYDRYRTLFTSVFMDHHLFGPAYGLDVADPARVEALLHRFNLGGIGRLYSYPPPELPQRQILPAQCIGHPWRSRVCSGSK